MTENTKYLDELLLSYKQTIHELKQSNRDLKDIIDKLLHNHHKNVKECHDNINKMNTMENESEYYDGDDDDNDDNDDNSESYDNSESEEENENVSVNQSINSQTLQDIFKIVDEYNQSRSVKSFPSYEYFKNRGITRYMISKEKGLKTLRKKYFESRTFT